MEHSWRPRPPPPPPPPPGNTTPCPFCLNYHFPFCHPPLPQYFRPPPPSPPPPPDQFYPNPVPPPPPDQFYPNPVPPPPPDQFYPNPVPPPPPDQFYPNPVPPPPLPPQYDPFVDHQAPPAVNPYNHPPPPPLPHSRWNSKPSFGHGNLDYEKSSSQIGGVKRMRLDNVGEDERRLKLIRDHGAVGHSPDRKYDVGNRFAGSGLDHGEKRGNFGIENGYSQEDSLDVKCKYGGEVQFAFCRGEDNSSLVRNHGYGNGVRGGDDGYGSLGQTPMSRDCWGYEYGPYQDFNGQFPRSHATQRPVVTPRPSYYGSPNPSEIVRPINGAQGFKGQQPPLPTSPPPPIPAAPPGVRFAESVVSSSAPRPSSLFPIAASSAPSMQSQYTVGSEDVMSLSTHYSSKANPSSRGYYAEAIPGISQSSSKTFMRDSGELPPERPSLEKPKVVDAAHILKHPYRDSRPDHIVIILRGLPGGGKSYMAKILRDLEVENGGAAPRIHSMDDYFMTEVEESEGSRSSGTVKGKKQVTKKVMEYCYEPEMEEAYRSSMLKAFKKTLDEGAFPLVIVDDRNLRVADFAQFWATAKRSGYEVYLLEATYKDPAGCAARNVHSFTQNDIQKMADQWEEAPSLYMKLDIKSLLHGGDLEENGIQEVDMDTEDDNDVGGSSGLEHKNSENVTGPSKGELSGPVNDEHEWDDAAEDHPTEVVKELGKSKWSNVVDEDDVHKTEVNNRSPSARSGLIKSYSKKGKSVRWSDQVGKIGFSISAGKAANVSLVIGPGSGYNLKSNPLPEEEKLTQRTGEPKRKNVFQEQLRAERESFRAVFDKRRQRIRGIDVDEE